MTRDSRTALKRLLVVSHVLHYQHRGRIHAYGPYAREMEIWADLCQELVIAAPCREEPPPSDCLPLLRENLRVSPLPETGGTTIAAKLRLLLALPRLTWSLYRRMRRADAVHVRCPGNLGGLGAVLAPLASPRIVAKYAGAWTGFPGEPWTWRLQRAVLRSRWWRGPVTVYGDWPAQPDHVVPFFTSLLSAEQLDRARCAARKKRLARPLEVLYVGRLSAAKNVDVLIEALVRLAAWGVPVRATVVGDGPERRTLESLAAARGLNGAVDFVGAVDFQQVPGYYEQAHVLVLASEGEGWPKAIAEAMAFGLVAVGSNRGLMPEMLGQGRGLVVPPRDVEALAEVLRRLAASPDEYLAMSRRAALWGQRHSLEDLRAAIGGLLAAWWRVPLAKPRSPDASPLIEGGP